jgi:hypothetical protein
MNIPKQLIDNLRSFCSDVSGNERSYMLEMETYDILRSDPTCPSKEALLCKHDESTFQNVKRNESNLNAWNRYPGTKSVKGV